MKFSRLPHCIGPFLLLLPLASFADDGEASYLKRCAPCHQANGHGIAGQFPPLIGMRRWLATEAGRTYITRIVMQGYAGPITVQALDYQGLMLTYRGRMSDAEFVSVLRYVAETLNQPIDGYKPIDLPMVAAARAMATNDGEIEELRAQLPDR